jgi:hypothetical protein
MERVLARSRTRPCAASPRRAHDTTGSYAVKHDMRRQAAAVPCGNCQGGPEGRPVARRAERARRAAWDPSAVYVVTWTNFKARRKSMNDATKVQTIPKLDSWL